MILKSYEINKINIKLNKFILFYGQNEGFKNQSIKTLIKEEKDFEIFEEKEILNNNVNFLEDLYSKSLFQTNKTIIIKRATDKIINFLIDIRDKNIDDVTFIINSESLEKKSKLRSLFEKEKKFICVAFYQDDQQTLFRLAENFLRGRNILISNLDINIIINKCNGDRQNLFNELEKISLFLKDKKKITTEIINKLINLSEDHNITELVNYSLAKNTKKVINIINENNFSNEDCIIIVRTFLTKSKKILQLLNEFQKNNNIELTINNAKPPIFWKDKEIIKQQISAWKPKKINRLIYKINDLELNIKKNLGNSINYMIDFILELSISTNN